MSYNKGELSKPKVSLFFIISHGDGILILWNLAAANKEELLEMITHGADKIINSSEEYVQVH